MISKPELFSAPMVRAILEGRKTQTRRIMKPQPIWASDGVMFWKDKVGMIHSHDIPHPVGSGIWVRETWRETVAQRAGLNIVQYNADRAARYVICANSGEGDPIGLGSVCRDPWGQENARWRPSIHMPRWASRITLEVTAVKVGRVASISEEDAKAEGAPDITTPDWPTIADYHPVDAFADLWDSLYATRPGCSFEANPYVFAYTFRRVE